MTKTDIIAEIKTLKDLIYIDKVNSIEKMIKESEIDIFDDEDVLEVLLDGEESTLRLFHSINKRIIN
jgi:N-acyl-L-homoserine lactone synthetase